MGISVSIIVPIYNVEQYLPECLDSVLAQTLEHIEIICVNDCSPDNSLEILESYVERDKRIIILNHDQNRGQSVARNTGLKKASGDYVFFLDPDDILFANDSLAHLYDIAIEDGADEVIGATLRWYEQTGERLLEYHKDYLQDNLRKVTFQDYPAFRHNAIGCNKLLKRTFLENNNICFNINLRKFEDTVFSWKTHLLAHSISVTLKATYLHRLRLSENSKSIMQDTENDVESHILAAQDMLDFLADRPKLEGLRYYFDRYFFSWCFLDVRRLNKQRPTLRKKKEILNAYYHGVLSRIPEVSPLVNVIPGRYREALDLMQKGQIEESWEVLTVEDFETYQLVSLQQQLDAAYNSWSWKVMEPLRWVSTMVKRMKRA